LDLWICKSRVGWDFVPNSTEELYSATLGLLAGFQGLLTLTVEHRSSVVGWHVSFCATLCYSAVSAAACVRLSVCHKSVPELIDFIFVIQAICGLSYSVL